MIYDIKSVLKKFSTIFLLAIILRLLIMPFLFHPDLKTHYYHGNFLSQGVVNIYQYIEDNKKNLAYTDTFNYPPITYFYFGSWANITRPFLGNDFQNWMNNWSESWFTNDHIFRLLFILKFPYLVLDLLIGLTLALLLEEKFRKRGLVLWFFNPVSLYIIYGISNFDIIPTFLPLLSLLLIKKGKVFSSGISLGLAASFKLYPLLFLPFFLFLIIKSKEFKPLIIFLFGLAIPIFASMMFFTQNLPSIFNSGLTTGSLDLKIPIINLPIFPILFILLIIVSFVKIKNWRDMTFYSFMSLLILFSLSRIHPQWLIWILPFFVLFAAEKTKLIIFSIPLVIGYFLSVLLFEDRFLTLGILSPLLPNIYDVGFLEQTFFSNISKDMVTVISKGLFVSGAMLIICGIKSKLYFLEHSLGNKKIFLSLVVINLVFFISLFTLSIHYESDRILVASQTKDTKTIHISANNDFNYEFVLNEDNLNLISLKLKNPVFLNTDPFYFIIEDKTGNNLTTVNMSGQNIGDGDMVRLQFPPLEDIKTKPLIMKLRSETQNIYDNSIQVPTNEQNQPIYKMYRQGNFSETLITSINNFMNRFFKDVIFVFIWVSSIFLLTIASLKSLKLKSL